VNVVVVPVPVLVEPPVAVTVHVPVAGNPLNATLPVATLHVGWVIAPTVGAAGGVGALFIVVLDAVAADVQPSELVTVNVYEPAASPVNVVVVPVPDFVEPPVAVTVHVPVAGNPLNATLPVATLHVGWVIAPTVGAAGGVGAASITVLVEFPEVQPSAFVTVNVYVLLAASPLNVAVAPVPVRVVLFEPSVAVTVQLPVAGNPLNATLAVLSVHEGWVIVPTVGAVGGVGALFIVVLDAVAADVQPLALVTVNVYVPAANPVNVVVVPVPDFVEPPVAVTVHVPVAGRPLNSTLPVETLQVGWVILPIEGAAGNALMVISLVTLDVHPFSVTVYVIIAVPAATEVIKPVLAPIVATDVFEDVQLNVDSSRPFI
jgi:hypothetical protein